MSTWKSNTPDQRLRADWVSGSARPCGVAWDAVPKSWFDKTPARKATIDMRPRKRTRAHARLRAHSYICRRSETGAQCRSRMRRCRRGPRARPAPSLAIPISASAHALSATACAGRLQTRPVGRTPAAVAAAAAAAAAAADMSRPAPPRFVHHRVCWPAARTHASSHLHTGGPVGGSGRARSDGILPGRLQ